MAVKDEAGNQSQPSDAITITVDTTAPSKPAAPVVSDDVGAVTGTITEGDKTDDTQPNIAVPPLAAGEEVVLIVDGESVPFITNEDGTISPETPLTEGDHSVQVAVKDEAGNQSQPSDAI
ncbi:hypothetical protein IQA72_17230, partial [Leptospira borgpetersenii serovar Ballum]|nr:hypothetical protein [Leptospira borgpetersenii serovar Ballum]